MFSHVVLAARVRLIIVAHGVAVARRRADIRIGGVRRAQVWKRDRGNDRLVLL